MEFMDEPFRRRGMRHYYGDTVRVLFVSAAVVLMVAGTTGATLPVSSAAAVTWAVVLAIAAGITNPAQRWIHWVNEVLAILGTLVFAISAVDHWRTGASVLDPSYVFVELVALISISTLYFSTKTIRGIMLNPHLPQ